MSLISGFFYYIFVCVSSRPTLHALFIVSDKQEVSYFLSVGVANIKILCFFIPNQSALHAIPQWPRPVSKRPTCSETNDGIGTLGSSRLFVTEKHWNALSIACVATVWLSLLLRHQLRLDHLHLMKMHKRAWGDTKWPRSHFFFVPFLAEAIRKPFIV